MDFDLTGEQRDIQRAAEEFAKGEFDPEAALQCDMDQQFPSALRKKAWELGFVGVHIPEEYGGQGLGLLENVLVVEAFCRRDSGMGMALALSDFGSEIILRHGNLEQKGRILPDIFRAGGMSTVACFEQGYALYPFDTFARRRNRGYSIHGKKSFVPLARTARYLIVVCQTGTGDPKSQSVFVLEKGQEGLRVEGVGDRVGMRMISMDEVSLHCPEIPEDDRIGQENMGHPYLLDFFNEMRIEVGAMAAGIGRGALDRALEYSKKRAQFGRSIASFDAIRNKLADMLVNTELARLVTYRAAWSWDSGRPDLRAILMAKCTGCAMAYRVAFDALQIHGGLGYMKETPIEHFFRDAKVLDLFMGSGQIQRNILADHMLGERKRG